MSQPVLKVVPSADDVHTTFAEWLAHFIRERNAAGLPTCLILPVGPTRGYPHLADLCNHQSISWQNVSLVTMDEYLDWTGRPIPTSHPLSFTGFMLRFLESLRPELRPPSHHYVWPDPFDIERVTSFLDNAGGANACLGGIGVHGHIAFNEPPNAGFSRVSVEDFLASPTRVVSLSNETMVMNATRAAGGDLESFPPLAVTIGMADIMRAERVRLFCDGGVWQQTALMRAMGPEEMLDYPVTLLQRHSDVEIIADIVTAERIPPPTNSPNATAPSSTPLDTQ